MEEKSRILLVEDLSNWQSIIKRLLDKDVYDVVTADSLVTAKTCLRKQSFDVAIVDIRLEDGDINNTDGIAFLDELEKYYPEDRVHAIMLSGHADEKHTRDALVRPSQMVLDFFFKQDLTKESEEKRFILEIEHAVRATDADRSSRSDKLVRPILPPSFYSVIDIPKLVEAINSGVSESDATRDLQQLLSNLLFSKSPFAKEVKYVVESFADAFIVNLLCWSRKSIHAWGVTIGKRSDDAVVRQANVYWAKFGSQDVVAESSTKYFSGVVYELADLGFEEFVSITPSK